MSSSIGASAGIFTCDQPFGVGRGAKDCGTEGGEGRGSHAFLPLERGSDGGVRKWELALLGKKQAFFPQCLGLPTVTSALPSVRRSARSISPRSLLNGPC